MPMRQRQSNGCAKRSVAEIEFMISFVNFHNEKKTSTYSRELNGAIKCNTCQIMDVFDSYHGVSRDFALYLANLFQLSGTLFCSVVCRCCLSWKGFFAPDDLPRLLRWVN